MIFRTFLRVDRPFSDPGGARTHDPMIKSHLLYQLSHGVIACGGVGVLPFASAKLMRYFEFSKYFGVFFDLNVYF